MLSYPIVQLYIPWSPHQLELFTSLAQAAAVKLDKVLRRMAIDAPKIGRWVPLFGAKN